MLLPKKIMNIWHTLHSHIYKVPTTGIKFFSVYGPWGRPDMALFIFTKNNKKRIIEIFNYGDMERDFYLYR